MQEKNQIQQQSPNQPQPFQLKPYEPSHKTHLCFSKSCIDLEKMNNQATHVIRTDKQAFICNKKHKTKIFSLQDINQAIEGIKDQNLEECHKQLQKDFQALDLLFKQSYYVLLDLLNFQNTVNEGSIEWASQWINKYFHVENKQDIKMQFNQGRVIDDFLLVTNQLANNLQVIQNKVSKFRPIYYPEIKLSQKIQSTNSNNQQQSQSANLQSKNQNPISSLSASYISSQQNQQQLQQQLNNIKLDPYVSQSSQLSQKNTLSRLQSKVNFENDDDELKEKIEKKVKCNSEVSMQTPINNKSEYQQKSINNPILSTPQSSILNHSDSISTCVTNISEKNNTLNQQFKIKQQADSYRSYNKELFPDSSPEMDSKIQKQPQQKKQVQTQKRQRNKKPFVLSPDQRTLSQFYTVISKKEEANATEEEDKEQYKELKKTNKIVSNQTQVESEMNIEINNTEVICIDEEEENCDQALINLKLVNQTEELKKYIQLKSSKPEITILGVVGDKIYSKQDQIIYESKIESDIPPKTFSKILTKDQVVEQNLKKICSCIMHEEHEDRLITISVITNNKLYLTLRQHNQRPQNIELRNIQDTESIRLMTCIYNQTNKMIFLAILRENTLQVYEISIQNLKKIYISEPCQIPIDQNSLMSSKLNLKMICDIEEDGSNAHYYRIFVYDFQNIKCIKVQNKNNQLEQLSQEITTQIQEGISFLKSLTINKKPTLYCGLSNKALLRFNIDSTFKYTLVESKQCGFSEDCFLLDDQTIVIVVQNGLIYYNLNDKSTLFQRQQVFNSAIKYKNSTLALSNDEALQKKQFYNIEKSEGKQFQL